MNKDDLKRAVNSLMADDDTMPKPEILPGPPTNKILFDGPLPTQAELDSVK